MLEDYSPDLWESLPAAARLKITADDLAMKSYILQCESMMEIHNE